MAVTYPTTPRIHPLDQDLARTLAQKLLDGQLVLFAGAGLSHLATAKDGSDHRLPLWRDFIDAIAKQFDIRTSSASFLDVLDIVITKGERKKLLEATTELLDDAKFNLSPAHLALKELPWSEVVTTNYDHLLGRLFDISHPICSDDDCVSMVCNNSHAPRLFHIHGALPAPHTFTRKDYRNWEKNHPVLAQEIRNWSLRKTILFVGYGLGDSNIETLLDTTTEWTKDWYKLFFALSWRLEKHDIQLLLHRDKIQAASIETEEEWQNAFQQIKAEFDLLKDQGSTAQAVQPDYDYAYDRAQYLQALGTRYGVANLQALCIRGTGYARDDIKLEEIFVEPDLCELQIMRSLRECDEETTLEENPAEDSEYTQARKRMEPSREQAPRRESALAMLGRESRLCIIGAPGQGKSTLLRHYLLKSAAAWRESPAQQPLPVYLCLSEWQQHPGGLLSWAGQSIAGMGEISGPALDAWLKGRVLWLLDGVDEIRDPYERHNLQEKLSTLLTSRPQDRAVLATRPQGYLPGSFGSAWRDVELPPLSPEESRKVLVNWGKVLQSKEKSSFDAVSVDQGLERQPELRQIRGNALLLTLVVLFYKNKRHLPADRWEFFKDSENELCFSWPNFKYPKADQIIPGDYLPIFLERLALLGMMQGIVSFPTETLKKVANKVLKERDYTGRDKDNEIKRLLRAADDLIGVIAAQAPERYGFLHLAFQEFLAAHALVTNTEWCRQIIAHYWDEPDWSEVWSFYAKGIAKEETRLRELFSVIQDNVHDLDQYLHRDKLACLRLGGFCLGALPAVWEGLEAWALQGLNTDNRFAIYAMLKERERPLSPQFLDVLLKKLAYGDRDERLAAAETLPGQTEVPGVIDELLKLLGDEYSGVSPSSRSPPRFPPIFAIPMALSH